MQERFIVNLRKILEQGEERALLISATGTGKTYASAFAMREMGFQRVLFLVHRNQIAKQAIKSYRKVFGGSVSMGMVTGKYQEYDKDYIFATIQTLSKEETLQRYSRQRFDAIVIDEAHHSAANSYKKVLDYFQPKLWLGMTATPDKRDDNLEGRNIYEIFNHQIAYEIRLQDAMEEDLLCPFHYFGITDLDLIADGGKSSEEKIENFRHLTSDERVENVMKQARYFGYSGERVKGLIFCSRIDEAKELSAKFNKNGWRTLVLSGNDSEEIYISIPEDKWNEFANDFSVQVYNNKEDYRKNSLIISALLAILGGVATYFISGHALKPLREFSDKIEEVQIQNLADSRIEESKIKELNQLSVSYNKMLERLQDAFEVQRQFTANAAHELRTPLSLMQVQLDLYHSTQHPGSDADT